MCFIVKLIRFILAFVDTLQGKSKYFYTILNARQTLYDIVELYVVGCIVSFDDDFKTSRNALLSTSID